MTILQMVFKCGIIFTVVVRMEENILEIDLYIIDTQMIELLKEKNYFIEKSQTFVSGAYNATDDIASFLNVINNTYTTLADNVGNIYNYLKDYTSDIYMIENRFLGIPLEATDTDDSLVFNTEDYMSIPGMTFESALYYQTLRNNGINTVILTDSMIEELMPLLSKLILSANEKEKIPYYYVQAKSFLGNNAPTDELIKYAKIFMAEDAKNGYNMLHSTPRSCYGEIPIPHQYNFLGDYLQYYNEYGINVIAPLYEFTADEDGDASYTWLTGSLRSKNINLTTNYYVDIMNNASNYPDKVKEQGLGNINNLFLYYGAIEYASPDHINTGAAYLGDRDIILRTDLLVGYYNTLIGTSDHELGHIYGQVTGYHDGDKAQEWENIYQQIVEQNPSVLRDYAYTNIYECYADCFAEYIDSKNGNPDFNSYDLKKIVVEVDGKEITMYDYFDNMLN